jgi:uncharacterized protein with GYD domain
VCRRSLYPGDQLTYKSISIASSGGGDRMPRYMIQGGYAAEAWAGMVQKPEDRTGVVRAAAESLGGKLESIYFTFGQDDFVVIVEMPDNVSAAAISIAVGATGRYRNLRTIPLITPDEMVRSLQSAGKVNFRAAGT